MTLSRHSANTGRMNKMFIHQVCSWFDEKSTKPMGGVNGPNLMSRPVCCCDGDSPAGPVLTCSRLSLLSTPEVRTPEPSLRVLTFKLENATEDQVRAILEPVSKSLDIRTV